MGLEGLRYAALAVAAAAAAWVFRGSSVPALPEGDPRVRLAWRRLTEENEGISEEQLQTVARKGRVHLQSAVPAGMIEDLLLPELALLETPEWATVNLPHVTGRFGVVRYGVSLESRAARDFWEHGPASKIAGRLLGQTSLDQGIVLAADVYYSVVGNGTGLERHTDSRSSYSLTAPDSAGLSFWLALDDASEATGGSLEVCDVGGEACEVYGVRRGDVILFDRHSPHRTVPWRDAGGARRQRRALVGRLVPHDAVLARSRALPALVYTNAFHGPYLCQGLRRGALLREYPCFPELGAGRSEEVRLSSPYWPIFEQRLLNLLGPLHGLRLSQAIALMTTLFLELAVATLWWFLYAYAAAPNLPRVLAACASATFITHPFVWLWSAVLFRKQDYMLRVVAIESIIMVVEFLVCRLTLTAPGETIGVIWLPFAVGMNLVSWGMGHWLAENLRWAGSGFSPSTSACSLVLALVLVLRLRGRL